MIVFTKGEMIDSVIGPSMGTLNSNDVMRNQSRTGSAIKNQKLNSRFLDDR